MGTVTQQWLAADCDVGSSNIPEFVLIQGTNNPVPGVAFGTANQAIFKTFVANDYGSGNLTVKLGWYSRSGSTSSTTTWGAAIQCITPGDAQSIETDSFATETTQATTVNGTAKGLTETSITVSNLDSIAAGDTVTLRIRMTAKGMTGDAILETISVAYSS
jgi:hypothetical protein